MIVDAILLLAQSIIDLLLLPLTALNFVIDFTSSIPIVSQFLQLVAYLLPWSNLLPLIIFIIAMFVFRGVLSLIKLIWSFIPIIGS